APLSSVGPGDPSTDALVSYPGDPVMIRFLYAGQAASRGVGTFGVTGHRFPVEPHLAGSRTTDALSVAESSQHNLALECGAGGCLGIPGDYMYWMTQPEFVDRGAWGLLRVLDPGAGRPIRALPSNAAPVAGSMPTGVPVRHYDVAAIEGPVVVNPAAGLVRNVARFVPADALPSPVAEPLVLRALPGEIVEVTLENRLVGSPVSLHAGLLSAGPADPGIAIGFAPQGSVAPGSTRTYRWFADREVGVVDLTSMADPVRDAERGLYGALVIEPAGATWDRAVGPGATLTLADGTRVREHVLLYATPDGQFESSTMPYHPDLREAALVNYASEPAVRPGVGTCHTDPDFCHGRPMEVRNPVAALLAAGRQPSTPIVAAVLGEPLVVRSIGSSGDQISTYAIGGHVFAKDPDMPACRTDLAACRSTLIDTYTLGPRETNNAWIPAAGPGGAGDYVYRNHRDAMFEAGSWGLVRVAPRVPYLW
ncbi:MAG: hypothetical protein ACT4PT_03110, partial [Methanobacteriota archaeon]